MEELGEEDVLDPNPDIHALFCYYNSLYFGDSLGACSVSWSSSRMTREAQGLSVTLGILFLIFWLHCLEKFSFLLLYVLANFISIRKFQVFCCLCAGVCRYQQSGGCEICLSEPLLKFRPTADLKNTLLHEMIHAFLWIENRNRDHSDHGPNFQRLMNDINCSSVDDHQRPPGGYNITVYHDFHAEVESYQVHQWMCESCGDLIKRAMNRAPSAIDCIEKVKHCVSCGNPSCHWHRHKMVCSGSYTKTAEPPGYEGKRLKGKHQKDGRRQLSHASGERAAKTHKAVGIKDKSDVQSSKAITNFFPVVDTGNLDVDDNSSSGDFCHDNSKAIVLKHSNILVPEQIPRGSRTRVSRRKRKLTKVAQKYHSHESKYTVMSRWLDWFAEEEEGYEVIEPLINKRTERRKKQRTFMNSRRRDMEDETIPDPSPKDIDLEVIKNIDPVAASCQDSIDDRGASQLEVSGFCRGIDSLHDLTGDDGALSLNQSVKVNILEISDD